jgi:site-specific DNA-cytosine methylase
MAAYGLVPRPHQGAAAHLPTVGTLASEGADQGEGAMSLRLVELFAGYGGLGLGLSSVIGTELVGVSEIEPAACRVLAVRWPRVPNLGDITDYAFPERVALLKPDILTGGFPCQDMSLAGKRAGLREGTRSGLWTKFRDVIAACRPLLVVAENVKGIRSADADSDVEWCPWCVGDGSARPLRALGAVLGDLASLGYDAAWTSVRASQVGAPHERERESSSSRGLPTPRASDGAGGGYVSPGFRPTLQDWARNLPFANPKDSCQPSGPAKPTIA